MLTFIVVWAVGIVPALFIFVEVYEDAAVSERWRRCRSLNVEFEEDLHRRRVRAWLMLASVLWPITVTVRITGVLVAIFARR